MPGPTVEVRSPRNLLPRAALSMFMHFIVRNREHEGDRRAADQVALCTASRGGRACRLSSSTRLDELRAVIGLPRWWRSRTVDSKTTGRRSDSGMARHRSKSQFIFEVLLDTRGDGAAGIHRDSDLLGRNTLLLNKHAESSKGSFSPILGGF